MGSSTSCLSATEEVVLGKSDGKARRGRKEAQRGSPPTFKVHSYQNYARVFVVHTGRA